MTYNLTKLDRAIRAAGIPIHGVSGSTVGRIDFCDEATDEQRRIAEAIRAAHDPASSYADLRAKEYARRGLTAEALAVALWERDVEGRPEAAAALQAIRASIKAQFPKPPVT